MRGNLQELIFHGLYQTVPCFSMFRYVNVVFFSCATNIYVFEFEMLSSFWFSFILGTYPKFCPFYFSLIFNYLLVLYRWDKKR
jgi:hypothetical protein